MCVCVCVCVCVYKEDLVLNFPTMVDMQKKKKSYIINIYGKRKFGINNIQGLICHKNQPTN